MSDIDIDPRDTLQLAETESTLWNEAQPTLTQRVTQLREPATLPQIPGRWCFMDGSWKEGEYYSGHGWYSTLEGFDELMGTRNTRGSLSPLHSEIEALIWETKL